MERPAGVEPAISALATQRLTARPQPLINWLREGIRTQTIRGSKDRSPAIRRSRNIFLSIRKTHITYPCQLLH